MPVLLSPGANYAVVTTDIIALPANGCRIFVTASTATSIDLSNDATMANPVNILKTAGGPFDGAGAPVSSGFIRVNGGAALIRVTKA